MHDIVHRDLKCGLPAPLRLDAFEKYLPGLKISFIVPKPQILALLSRILACERAIGVFLSRNRDASSAPSIFILRKNSSILWPAALVMLLLVCLSRRNALP